MEAAMLIPADASRDEESAGLVTLRRADVRSLFEVLELTFLPLPVPLPPCPPLLPLSSLPHVLPRLSPQLQ
jgi:hypothetical protein